MNLSKVYRCVSISTNSKSSVNRLGEIARQVIDILRQEDQYIRSDDLAEKIQVPKRRIYDVIAILKAVNLVSTSRDRSGTMVQWVAGKENSPQILEFETNKIKIKTSGEFKSVVNRGTEVILESTVAYITIEDI